MSYTVIKGNLFNSSAKALGNTVNTKGVMGKGIALEFKRRFPKMYKEYKKDCDHFKINAGEVHYYQEDGITIVNFTTKDHWKQPSKMEWIELALDQFAGEYMQKGIKRIALPVLGASLGQLDEQTVLDLMEKKLAELPELEGEVYRFDPTCGDPLFWKLKDICEKGMSKEFKTKAGLEKESIASSLSEWVLEPTGKSLAMLEGEAKFKDVNMDNLYKALLTNPQKNKSKKSGKKKNEGQYTLL